MIEIIAGIAGGLGLFFVGMWLLTENLRALASRRLRMIAHRWTENGLSGFSWGALAGTVTQNSTALTFILVSMLRSGLISTRGALIVLIGGNIGVTLLVLVVTFDIELISMCVLGVAGVAMISERLSRYRPIAAYFGGGAYAAALLVKFADAPFELAFWAAPAGGALLAILFGWFCVRLSGVYFPMLTLAFAQIAWAFVFQDMPGSVLKSFGIADEFGAPLKITGDDGLNDIWPSPWASARVAYYYITVGLAVAALWLMRRILYAPFGYTLRAGRDSPLRAAAIGIDLTRHRWLAFTVSGAFTGLAGALFLFSKGSIFPTTLEIARSFDALLMVLLGGVQSLFGPIFGAAALTWLNDLFSVLSYWRFLLGVTIIALVLLLPQGLVGFAGTWLGRRLRLARPEEMAT